MFSIRGVSRSLRALWPVQNRRASNRATSTSTKVVATTLFGTACFGAGFAIGRDDASVRSRHIPNPRSCCDAGPEQQRESPRRTALVAALRARIGQASVVTDANAASPFTVGARIGGGGDVVAVACPNSLQQAIETLQICVDAGVPVIPQGANTGLTGGSVPRGHTHEETNRGSVVLNMRKLNSVFAVGGGQRVVCLAGAGILDVNEACARLDKGRGREAHSALGSTFLNPSVAGGVSFGSGGTQIRKGPAYTERSLYCVVGEDGKVCLVNTLGLATAALTIEELLERLDTGGQGLDEEGPRSTDAVTRGTTAGGGGGGGCGADAAPGAAYDRSYAQRVCELAGAAGEQCSRFNADTSGPPPNRCEGKVLVLATVHETFPRPVKTRTLWVSCADASGAAAVRRACLTCPEDLPASCEYMDAQCCDTVDRGGRALVFLIRSLGMSPMGAVWALRQRLDALPLPYAKGLVDRLTWWVLNPLLPPILTPKVQALMKKRPHNVLIEACDFASQPEEEEEEEAAPPPTPESSSSNASSGTGAGAPNTSTTSERLIARILKATKEHDVEVVALEEEEGGGGGDEASSGGSLDLEKEGAAVAVVCERGAASRAKLFRFACAPAFATRVWGEGAQGLSLDYALPKRHDGIAFDGVPAALPRPQAEERAEGGGQKEGRRSEHALGAVLPEGVEPLARCVYGHFGCNVVHEDLLFAPGVDVPECKRRIKAAVEAQGGKLPAEHGHGTEYKAPPETQDRWMKIDPTNALNPGVGGTNAGPHYSGSSGLSH